MSAPENLYRRFVDAQEEAKRLSQRLARLEDQLVALTAEIRASTSRLAEQRGDNLRPEASA